MNKKRIGTTYANCAIEVGLNTIARRERQEHKSDYEPSIHGASWSLDRLARDIQQPRTPRQAKTSERDEAAAVPSQKSAASSLDWRISANWYGLLLSDELLFRGTTCWEGNRLRAERLLLPVRYADFIEGAPGRRGKKAVKSPRSRRKGHRR